VFSGNSTKNRRKTEKGWEVFGKGGEYVEKRGIPLIQLDGKGINCYHLSERRKRVG
jgi:hypothetical protein